MSIERILVVDDEESIREIISSMLSAAGYKTAQASSGMEALAVLNSHGEFELMLSDLMMAELDGIALLERSKEKYPDMPVIMVTAVHDISVALAAIRNGAYDYLLKPFEREQLLAMVRRALEHRRLKLENRAYQSNLESLVAARTEQLRQTMTDLERSYDITLEALGDALDLKDAETEGHSKRVTAFTIAIARAMGLSGERIRIIARGAFLHDIGKMAIPDAILRKPGSLTPEETAIMREHCYRGYQMLRKIPFLSEASDIVYAHQERYDGTGYPRGLKGDEIPLGARIFSVADTLDAITSDRPYRAAQTVAAAREEVLRYSGTQFDPEVVRVFMQMPDTIWEDLRKEINSQIYRFTYHSTSPSPSKTGSPAVTAGRPS
ncbi:MAG TPA: HD domain-containing phosphohydrolase [Candidatus Angelobacter sp.]|nr:HD domain-containing phosphohydrolase [Candidatus Angelobacter sp.]